MRTSRMLAQGHVVVRGARGVWMGETSYSASWHVGLTVGDSERQ